MNTLINIPPLKICVLTDEVARSYHGDSVTLLINLQGEARVSVNNVLHSLGANDVIVINSQDVCTVFKSDALTISCTIQKSLLKLESEDLSAYFMCNSTQFKIKDKFFKLRLSVFSAIKQRGELTRARAFSVAYDIYDELLKNFSMLSTEARKNNTKIVDILAYIEKNYSENLLLNDIAEKFNISVPYLSKFFKESMGVTFADFYDELRVNHSLYDLLDTSSTIIDVALKHGFPNNHAYIRAFKKVKGILPNEARKAHKCEKVQENRQSDEVSEVIEIATREQSSPSEYKDYYIREDYGRKALFTIEHNPGQEILGVGSAVSVLHKNVQTIIKNIQSQYPFRYAYIRGIFSDALSFCSKSVYGDLIFRFSMVDEVLDFLLSVNLIPVLSFTYMPRDLAKENKDLVYKDGYYICGPDDLEEWKQVITAFLNHAVNRYGEQNVKQWIFLPWVQLDSKNRHLGFSDEEAFFNFYKTSYQSVKEINSEFKVSSPEIYPSPDKKWLKTYLDWSKKNACTPDLLALKFFPNFNWEVIEVKDNYGVASRKVINEEISADENLLRNSLVDLKDFLKRNGYELDIYITAFNYTITDSHPLLDTLFSANYYLKNYTDNLELIKSLCYWKLTDDDETASTRDTFSGKVGMYLPNGIPKGTAQAIRLISYTKPIVIDRGAFYLLTVKKEQSDYFHLLLFNYEHPANSDVQSLMEYNDLYDAFINKEKKAVHLKIEGLPFKKACIKTFIVNTQHGAPYDKWRSMGMPELDRYADRGSVIFEIFEVSAIPDFKTYSATIEDGVLKLDFNLEPFEIKAVEILLEN